MIAIHLNPLETSTIDQIPVVSSIIEWNLVVFSDYHPPESSRIHQNSVESGAIHQNPLEYSIINQTSVEFSGCYPPEDN